MINYNIDEIRTMVYKLGQCVCDASNLVNRITGFEFAVVYEDECCAIAVAYNIDEDEKIRPLRHKSKARFSATAQTIQC
jgi:hypothetical protein